jgi:tryptophan 2,3-dioxygenase
MKDAPNYWDYLGLDRLLTLQGGLEGDEASLLPDELHFIVVHQTYELWFKLLLRSEAVRKTSNVLATTVAPVRYRRRMLLALARRVVDDLWTAA